MSSEELQRLEKEVAKAKRIASEWASQVHDLVEDRLPAAYEELPQLSQSTFDACRTWAELNAKLVQFKKALAA
ncbi:MAG: CCE_0567 family metalloprotein [Methylotetracoccus sp.]